MGWLGWLRTASVAVLLLATLALAPAQPAQAGQDDTRESVRRALFRYERWVHTQSDPIYGWTRDYVWPMSLYYLGEMYHALYRLTGEERYRAEVLRAADAAMRAGPEALWFSYRGFEQYASAPAAVLNALFIELFLDAAALSGQPRYAAHATLAVEQLRRTFFQHTLDADDHPQDYFMLSFYALARYLHRTGQVQPALHVLGQRLYERGLATLDRSTFRWYYDRRERDQGFYDGHAAYYQSVSALFFLHNAAHVRAVYPAAHRELSALLPGLVAVALDGTRETGTYYYAESVPDYTESAAQVIWLADLSQRLDGRDRRALIRRAGQTLVERQAWEGGFYSDEVYDGPRIGYSDNAGWALAHWLLGAQPELRPAGVTTYLPLAMRPVR